MSSLTNRIITIATDDCDSTFQVHEQLLRSRSPFFDAALSNSWKEGLQGRITLREDPNEIVKLYLLFLYFGKLHIDWTKTSEGLPDNDLLPEYITLARLYVFAEKIGDINCKNAIVRAMIKRMDIEIDECQYFPIGEAINIIYQGTTAGSKGRKLVVDAAVVHGHGGWIDPDVDGNNAEYLTDLSRALLDSRECAKSPSMTEMKDGRYEEAIDLGTAESTEVVSQE